MSQSNHGSLPNENERACDYIVEIMKIIGKVTSSSLQHNVNRNVEERPQLKDLRSNQIEKLYAYHIILNSIQLVTGIPGGNIQLYVVSSVMDLIFWIFFKEMNLTSHSWHHHSRCYNLSDLNIEYSHFFIFTRSLDSKSCKRIEIMESNGSRPSCSSGKCRGGLSEERADPRKTPSCQRIILREGNLSISSKNYSKVLDLMNHGRSDTDGGHDTLLIPIHGGARLGSIDRDLGHRDGKCFHIYSAL